MPAALSVTSLSRDRDFVSGRFQRGNMDVTQYAGACVGEGFGLEALLLKQASGSRCFHRCVVSARRLNFGVSIPLRWRSLPDC